MSPCNTGVLAGMTTVQLQAALATAQQAYTKLMTGGQVISVSYAQGEGSRSVTYSQSNIAGLTAFIAQLQQALGLTCRSRRAMGVRFR